MDEAGRLVIPKSLREAIGLAVGGIVDVSIYGAGLQVVPADRTARLHQTADGLVETSETVVADETVFGLIDSVRR